MKVTFIDKRIYVSEEVYAFFRYLVDVNERDYKTDKVAPTSMLKGFLYSENDIILDIFQDYGISCNEIEFYIEEQLMENEEKKQKKDNTKIKSVEVNCIENGDIKTIDMYESIFDVIVYALELVETYKEIEEVTLNILSIAFVQKLPTECYKILRQCDIPIKDLKKEITIQNVISKQIIPKELRNFLSDLNLEVDISKPCQVLGRDNETDKLWDILLKKEKANAILVGKPGVGKTAIVEKIAYEIVSNSCAKEFEDFHVISLSVNSIIAGTQYRGEAEQNFDVLIKYIEENQNIILFIDEIHTVLGAGACKEGEMDLANALKPILARGKSKVIGSTTFDEYKRYFSKDGALKRRFKKIVVEEPEIDEVYLMIKNKIKTLQEFHGVKISRKVIDECILYATCFDYETANPDRTLDIIDVAMAKAKRRKVKRVATKDILATFNMNFKALEKMSKEDIKAIAYHEAGHFVVATFSKNIKDEETLAISIVPADDYLGVNATNTLKYKQVIHTDKYLKEKIAMYFGGRIGEKYVTGRYDIGASGDLEEVTKIAKDYISKYGFSEKISHNHILFGENESISSSLSEQSKMAYEKEIDSLSTDCYKSAERIIKEHKELLELIAERLITDYILSKEQLKEIVKNYKSKNLIS